MNFIADIFGSPWPHFGVRGSLSHRVREHLDTNDALRRNRNSPGVRFIAKFLEGRSLAWFLRRYLVFAVVLGLAEIATAQYFPQLPPQWAAPDEKLSAFSKTPKAIYWGHE